VVARSRTTQPAAGFLIGLSSGFLLWLLLVSWNFSFLADDEIGPEIAAVGALVLATAGLLLTSSKARALAGPFAQGGLTARTALFAWRAGTAEVDNGANFFLIPLFVRVRAADAAHASCRARHRIPAREAMIRILNRTSSSRRSVAPRPMEVGCYPGSGVASLRMSATPVTSIVSPRAIIVAMSGHCMASGA
jgi:hypothetical protein